MYKSMFIGAIVLAVASALNLYELDNLIEYEDTPIHRIMPYPYQDNRVHLVESDEVRRYEPVNNRVHLVESDEVRRYEPVRVPIPEVPVPTTVVVPKTGIISSIASSIVSVAKSAISFIFNNIHALIFGSLSAIGLCKYTPICDKLAFSSFSEATREFSSFATPDRIKRASEFVKEAIKKYQSLQKK